MLHDLRYGMRTLRKNPTFALVAILALALGTGANAAIFQLVNALRLRSLPVEKPNELVSIGIDQHGKGRVAGGMRAARFSPSRCGRRSASSSRPSRRCSPGATVDGTYPAKAKPFLRLGSMSAEVSSTRLACTLRSVACSPSWTIKKDVARPAWCCRTGSGRPGSEAMRV